jgi:hypothetical protein
MSEIILESANMNQFHGCSNCKTMVAKEIDRSMTVSGFGSPMKYLSTYGCF